MSHVDVINERVVPEQSKKSIIDLISGKIIEINGEFYRYAQTGDIISRDSIGDFCAPATGIYKKSNKNVPGHWFLTSEPRSIEGFISLISKERA